MNLYKYITETGVIVPDTSDVRDDIESWMRSKFGSDLNLDPETPQGVLVTALTLAVDGMTRNNAKLANQINPALSSGIFLDTLSSFLGVYREPQTRSMIVGVKLSGRASTLIPKGSQARSQTGDLFETVSTEILNDKGEAFADMRAVKYGSIECPAGGLDAVASSVLGWEKVYNESQAIIGRKEESDRSLRLKRERTLALNTVSVNEAIISALYDLEGVHSLSYLENFTKAKQTIRGKSLEPHSIYVCIHGGVDEEIAKTLKDKKTIGGTYNGKITKTVIDEHSGQEYSVKFDRAKVIDLFAKVTVNSGSGNAKTLIPIIAEQFSNGELETDDGLTVGREASAFELASAINFIDARFYVRGVELSKDGKTWQSMIDVAVDEIAQIKQSAVQVIEV